MKLITVYGRKEPVQERNSSGLSTEGLYDVQIYRDRKAKNKFARFPWYYSNKPTRRNKYVTLNCFRWRLVWLKDQNYGK